MDALDFIVENWPCIVAALIFHKKIKNNKYVQADFLL